MRKILNLLLVAAFSVSMIPVANAAYIDIDVSSDYYLSAVRLKDLEVISGYDDGTFKPDNRITRAEFTKIVTCMMDKETETRALTSASGFYDVPNGSWAAPYINYAVSKEILSGYSDGSFGPDRTISFSEALTILLRTLGYTESEVGYFWPDNYLGAAASLGITEGMNYPADAPLTRATAAILTDRAMFTKPSGQAVDTYLETIGYTVLDDALILDTDSKSNNISILAGNMKLNNASTYIGKTQIAVMDGDVYEHAVVDKNGYLATVKAYGGDEGIAYETAIVSRLTENTIEYTTTDGRKGSYKADDSFVTYYDNNKMTFASAKGYMTNGTDVTFYGSNYGVWNIAVIGNSNDVDPVLASRDYSTNDEQFEGTQINKLNLIVYRDGEAATLGDIKAYDVVYYNKKTNTMDVYSKKVTGVYYSAEPSKAYVEKVTVGGKTYEIGYSAATNRLDASTGAYAIGDKVTLHLGKNDKVVFATDNSASFDYFAYGVVLSSYTRTAEKGANEGNTEYVASMFMTDGEVHEIVTDKLYKDNAGDFMRISYSGSKATLTRQSGTGISDYTGKINLDKRTVGNRYVLKDAAIIQRISDEDAATAECELLDFDNLTSASLEKSQIINVVSANAFGDIAILYVADFENTYEYGAVSSIVKTGEDVSGYKIFSGGATETYHLNGISKVSTYVGSGVGFKVSGNGLSKLIALTKLDSATSVGAVEGSRIMLNNNIYQMDAKVQIIDVTKTSQMREITVEELARIKNLTSVTLYSDRALSNGGVVRLVTVTSK